MNEALPPKGQTPLGSTETLDTVEASEPGVTIDFMRYAHHLDGLDISDDEKLALLRLLWDIAGEFVMLGFNVHPVQLACGKDDDSGGNPPVSSGNQVSLLGDFIQQNLADYTAPETERIGEGVKK